MRSITDILGVDDSGVVFGDNTGSGSGSGITNIQLTHPEEPPILVSDGGGVIDITPHAIHPPVFNKDAPPNEVTILGDTLPVYGVDNKPIRPIQRKPPIRINPNGTPVITQTSTPVNTTSTVATGFDLKTFAQDNALLLLLAAGGIGYLVLKGKK